MEVKSPKPDTITTAKNSSVRDPITGERYGVSGRTNPELVQSMVGCFADDPLFERVVQFMEDERAQEREEAEREADEEDVDAATVRMKNVASSRY